MLIKELIIANELNGENNWDKISEHSELSEDDLREYKDLLNWERVIRYNKFIPNDLLDEIITEGLVDVTMYGLWARISMSHASDPKFIKKYNKKLAMKTVAQKNNFKASELVTMIDIPKIGEGATQYFASDCYPFTVIEVNKKGNKIKVQGDTAKPDKDFNYYSNQNYVYEPNPNGVIYELRLTKNCEWVMVGGTTRFSIGVRRKRQNPSF